MWRGRGRVAHRIGAVEKTDLPVETCIPELRLALAESRHAVLQAPPGAGKTTIVPLRLLDEPWLDGQRIVMLEPRRLATRAAARRMADLLGRGGRRHRRVPHARRAPRRTGHPHRGRHRGHPHPPAPTGPVPPRHRTGDLRRDPRAQPPGRPRPRPHPRRPRRAASRPAHPGHVGHARHRPGGERDRRRRHRRR